MNKNRFIKKGITGICICFFGITMFITIKSHSMNRMVENEIGELISVAKNTEAITYSSKDIDDLPAPVQRYFRYVLKDGQEHIRFARMKAEGQFRRAGPEAMDKYEYTSIFYCKTARYDIRCGYEAGACMV